MSPSQLSDLNTQISEGAVSHRDGSPVTTALGAGLCTDDGSFAYRVDQGIIELLAHRAIPLEAPEASVEQEHGSGDFLSAEKDVVRSFYDTFGWHQNEDGVYMDTVTYADLRRVSRHALDAAHGRVKRYLGDAGGDYLLDVASGPVLAPYMGYGERFDYRICIDLSITALRQAQQRLGDRGVYILGDITNLPLLDDAVDGVVSLHTIYHVPADEQATAFREVYRVLKPGGSAVVVYRWLRISTPWSDLPPARRVLAFPWRALKKALRFEAAPPPDSRGDSGTPEPPPQYFHAHTYQWFVGQDWPFRPKIVAWSAVSTESRQKYIRDGPLGRLPRLLLRLFETSLPGVAGRVGTYPLIVLDKPAQPSGADHAPAMPDSA